MTRTQIRWTAASEYVRLVCSLLTSALRCRDALSSCSVAVRVGQQPKRALTYSFYFAAEEVASLIRPARPRRNFQPPAARPTGWRPEHKRATLSGERVGASRHYWTACTLFGTPTVVLGDDARVIDVNPACERVTGFERADLLGRSASVLIPPVEVSAHAQWWADLVAGRSARYELPGTLRCVDDALLEYRFVAHLVCDAMGLPAGAVALGQPRWPAGMPTLPASRWSTAAELAVLTLLAAGRTIAQIAAELDLTKRGVDYRLVQLRRKLHADGLAGSPMSSGALVARAYVLGVRHPAVWPPASRGRRGVVQLRTWLTLILHDLRLRPIPRRL